MAKEVAITYVDDIGIPEQSMSFTHRVYLFFFYSLANRGLLRGLFATWSRLPKCLRLIRMHVLDQGMSSSFMFHVYLTDAHEPKRTHQKN